MAIAGLIHIVLMLIILGLAWWLLTTFVLPKLAEPFPTIIIVVLAVAAILWLLTFFVPGSTLHIFNNH